MVKTHLGNIPTIDPLGLNNSEIELPRSADSVRNFHNVRIFSLIEIDINNKYNICIGPDLNCLQQSKSITSEYFSGESFNRLQESINSHTVFYFAPKYTKP